MSLRLGCLFLVVTTACTELPSGSSSSSSSSSGSASSMVVSSSSAGSSSSLAFDAGPPPDGGADPDNPDVAIRDTDCDGLSDLEEFSRRYTDGSRTDPNNPDTDGDGLLDGQEAQGSAPVATCAPTDADPSTRTDPTRADSDGDGVPDGAEDLDHNGRIDEHESDPRNPDTDDDTLPDGLEDANHDGMRSTGETSPILADTDEDGLADGLEDANKNGMVDDGETDPRLADTDGDGLLDGNEDRNLNGIVDEGETNPRAANEDTDMDGLVDEIELLITMTLPDDEDTDNDGLLDGLEDRNQNGQLDPDETDPRKPDTDCDGLLDSEEDDGDGILEDGETDPRTSDTDGDLLSDGVERSITSATASIGCVNIPLDEDSSTGTDPRLADTDGDLINDGTEDVNANGAQDDGETDPFRADTDGDGIPDGLEDRNQNHIEDPGETSPLESDIDTDGDGISDRRERAIGTNVDLADSDGDGLTDGEEDRNQDGILEEGETDPVRPDSDCDGLADGVEDPNKNGTVDPGETNPRNRDSDGDGLTDGVETGWRGMNLDPVYCSGGLVPPQDEAPATRTNPNNPDSDGDGLSDGAEDGNKNGRVDMGELDPSSSAGLTEPDVSACATPNLRPVQLIARDTTSADLLLAVAGSFDVITDLQVDSVQRGAMVFDRASQVAGFAFKMSPDVMGASAAVQLGNLEQRIRSAASLSDNLAQQFTTWDGHPAITSQYTLVDNGGDSVGKSANDVVLAILPTAAGLLTGESLGTAIGPFRLQLQVVVRSPETTIVVGALANLGGTVQEQQTRLFKVDDLTNGSALAQFGDTVGVQCDRMQVRPRQPVDILFVVDNSGSMSNEQNALAAAANAMAAQLQQSTVDWRISVITSDLDELGGDVFDWETNTWPNIPSSERCAYTNLMGTFPEGPRYCEFMRNAAAVDACVASLSICGNGTENFFRPIACLMGAEVNGTFHCGRNVAQAPYTGFAPPPGDYAMLPRTPEGMEHPRKLRQGAKLVVVFLTDTNDQSDGRFAAPPNDNLDGWVEFFRDIDGFNNASSNAFVGGIVCPTGTNCSDDFTTDRWQRFFSQSNGVFAALPSDNDPAQQEKIRIAVQEILDRAIGQASPYALSLPPISSTIKVATDAQTEGPCRTSDVPRSTIHGFDYDGTTRSIVFYGNCRPKGNQTGKGISVSYRYWIENSLDPNGTPAPCGGVCPPPFLCNPSTNACLCPSDCGREPDQPGLRCNTSTCDFFCPADCGQTCQLGLTCDPEQCACVCGPDCGGTAPGPGYACNQELCRYECPEDCGSAPPSENHVCNRTTCAWTCTADCNGQCGAGEVCDQATCTCACDASRPCPSGEARNPTTCQCECDAATLNCPTTHRPSADGCSCECKPDCGGCDDGFVCHTTLCECVSAGG